MRIIDDPRFEEVKRKEKRMVYMDTNGNINYLDFSKVKPNLNEFYPLVFLDAENVNKEFTLDGRFTTSGPVNLFFEEEYEELISNK
jgi:hypothetical protein